MPASLISPAFSAVWYPDQQYLKINPDNTQELFIDYVAAFRDRKAYLREWHLEVVNWCRQQRPPYPIPKMGDYDHVIVAAHGKPPRAIEMIAAAAQEHPWVLGRSAVPDPRLEGFLEYTSANLEAELDTFDFGIASYEAAIQGNPASKRRPPPSAPPAARPATFTSVRDLERAAGLDDGMDDDIDARHAAEADAATAEFDAMAGGDDDEQPILLQDDVEGMNDAVTEDAFDELLALEEEHDTAARGGRTENPRKASEERKKDARRGTQTSVPRKRGSARSAGTDAAPAETKASKGGKAWDPDAHKGRSLADGAAPFIGNG